MLGGRWPVDRDDVVAWLQLVEANRVPVVREAHRLDRFRIAPVEPPLVKLDLDALNRLGAIDRTTPPLALDARSNRTMANMSVLSGGLLHRLP
jgi:hypothetical protein